MLLRGIPSAIGGGFGSLRRFLSALLIGIRRGDQHLWPTAPLAVCLPSFAKTAKDGAPLVLVVPSEIKSARAGTLAPTHHVPSSSPNAGAWGGVLPSNSHPRISNDSAASATPFHW